MSEGTDKIVTKKDSEQPLANHCDDPNPRSLKDQSLHAGRLLAMCWLEAPYC